MNDDTRPVSTVYGGLPSRELLSCLRRKFGGLTFIPVPHLETSSHNGRRSVRDRCILGNMVLMFLMHELVVRMTLQADIVESLTNEIHGNSARIDGVCSGEWSLSSAMNGGSTRRGVIGT